MVMTSCSLHWVPTFWGNTYTVCLYQQYHPQRWYSAARTQAIVVQSSEILKWKSYIHTHVFMYVRVCVCMCVCVCLCMYLC